MAEVIPFRGILYNTSRVSGSDVVAPPYDIITPELRKALYEKNPYNIVRIDFGEEHTSDNETDNKYSRAAGCLNKWIEMGILSRSDRPCFYAYEMRYAAATGIKSLYGFFGLVRIEDLGNGIYPHEETHSKPKTDRLSLLKACDANTSPIFSIYNSPARKASAVIERVMKESPQIEAQDTMNNIHRLWVIENRQDIAEISHDLSDKAIFIADGHHRYETALEYRRMRGASSGKEPYNYVLMFLSNIADNNLTILPTHRVVRLKAGDVVEKLKGHFDIETIPLNADIINIMKDMTHVFGLYMKGDDKQYLLRYSGEGIRSTPPPLNTLDVTVLHNLVFKDLLDVTEVIYEMNVITAKEVVRNKGYDAVFFLNPTKVDDVEKVALSSLRMPPKSTYFYPKVMTGFVINSLKKSIQEV